MNNLPAFPTNPENGAIWGDTGMSLRDYFAAKAMQSLMMRRNMDGSTRERLCALAYSLADAMLKAREVQP
jgi:hypothetical protein